MSAAANISAHYVDLVSLTARQALSAVDITVLGNSDSSIDASDVKVFMKDIGGTRYGISCVGACLNRKLS